MRQPWITRADLKNNPDTIFVFGDNVERRGYGGQAAQMRGEPNAIGVATKWRPSMAPDAFFDDSIECHVEVMRDLEKVQKALDAGKLVVIPQDGIGTGLARLQSTAPKIHWFIENWFLTREQK
ncbi:hypothetical protein [Bradyrhizobium elkanii]|nr:hypothetical protein [Bradyrhizobium elkanii]WLB14259.1 hypothetical protein QIH87_26770 [Bradyrhizobium elkanii]WLB76307.1 hypothetical protein QIH89_21425 [Bradyrhizobium elkanii]